MKGTLAELVVFPRFTALVGEGTYASVPVDLSGFQSVALQVWRGRFLTTSGAGGGSFEIYLQESQDGVQWSDVDIDGITQPLQTDEALDLCRFSVGRRWFRVLVVVSTGTDGLRAALNVWATGFSVRRVS